jgi:hypothetical protein
MGLRKLEDVELIILDDDKVQWQILVSTEMSLQDFWKIFNYLFS